ncbi:MAG: hypothetical protein IKK13_01435 [Clostridia bacterium]|nr:hypothetical protein [Clostridia bacterium]
MVINLLIWQFNFGRRFIIVINSEASVRDFNFSVGIVGSWERVNINPCGVQPFSYGGAVYGGIFSGVLRVPVLSVMTRSSSSILAEPTSKEPLMVRVSSSLKSARVTSLTPALTVILS